MLLQERGMLSEAPNNVGPIPGQLGTNGDFGLPGTPGETGGLAGFDPVLMGLVRRAMPNLMAYDICGVQPMSGPTGLIFAMKSQYQARNADGLRGGPEALYNEPDFNFSADATGAPTVADPSTTGYDQNPDGSADGAGQLGTVNPSNPAANPGLLNDTDGESDYTAYETVTGTGSRGLDRETSEQLGSGSNLFNEMSFSIEKTSVFAKTRALKAEYTLELAQDL